MAVYFVTGIGTGIGKTLISGILCKSLDAEYWKPIQAGEDQRDSREIEVLSPTTVIHPEMYRLKKPVSPHIAAREEGIEIDISAIVKNIPVTAGNLIIEGPGGLMVPLNKTEFVSDLVKAIDCRIILVSRNYLGSINHSLLTARVCREEKLDIAGWIFNDQFGEYEEEIVQWSGYNKIFSVPYIPVIDAEFINQQADSMRKSAIHFLC